MGVPERRKLFLVVVAVIFANVLDLATTWLVSPDLADEWNVLERHLSLGWPGLIAAKLVGGMAAILGYAYYLLYHRACYPPAGLGAKAFVRYFALGRGDFEAPAIQATPFQRMLVNLGYFWAGIQVLVLWVALDNYLLNYNIVNPLRYRSELLYHILQSYLVAGLVLIRFHAGNWRRYRAGSGALEETGGQVAAAPALPYVIDCSADARRAAFRVRAQPVSRIHPRFRPPSR